MNHHVGRRLAGLVTAVAAVAIWAPAAAATADDGAPYDDPAAAGSIGFCDAAGRPVTHGSLDAIPFAAKAVGDFRPPAPYDGPQRSAVLVAYQPREGLAPNEWSGELLAPSTAYADPDLPTVLGTRGDISLRQFASDFPSSSDGFVQLRMFYVAPGQQTYNLRYAAANLRLTGDEWQLVGGSSVTCDSGKAVSLAAAFAPAAAKGKTSTSTSAVAGRAHSRHRDAGPGRALTGTATPSVAETSAAQTTTSGGSGAVTAIAVLAGLALLTATAVALRRRGRVQPINSPIAPNERHARR